MSASPPPIDSDPASDPFLERNTRQLAVLQRLAAIGMDLVEALYQRAGEDEPAGVALAFARIARAVRQTLALEVKLDEDRRAFEQAAKADRLRRAAEAKARRRAKQQRQIELAAGCLSEKPDEGPEAVQVMAGLRMELDQEDLSDDDERSIGEMVRGICAVLGLDFDPQLWGLEDAPDDMSGSDEEAVVGDTETWSPEPVFAGASPLASRSAPAATGPP